MRDILIMLQTHLFTEQPLEVYVAALSEIMKLADSKQKGTKGQTDL